MVLFRVTVAWAGQLEVEFAEFVGNHDAVVVLLMELVGMADTLEVLLWWW